MGEVGRCKKWRKSENLPKEVSLADNIVFSPPTGLAKIIQCQSPEPRTGLPNTRGEATSPRLPHSRGSAETSDEGESDNEDWARRAQTDIGDSSNYTCEPDLGVSHVIHNTKYGSEVLQGMKTAWKSANQHVEVKVGALADSKASALITSWDLAKKVKMMIFENGDATLKDASNKHLNVSGRGEIMVQEEYGLLHKIKVLISRDLGQDKLVVGFEDLKDLGILHQEFPRTLPEKRREDA